MHDEMQNIVITLVWKPRYYDKNIYYSTISFVESGILLQAGTAELIMKYILYNKFSGTFNRALWSIKSNVFT